MARLVFNAPFIEDLAALDEIDADEVWHKLELVEAVPGVGSSVLDAYLERMFGPNCLKIAAYCYDVIYERGNPEDKDDEVVQLHGIIHQRSIR